jgi:phosphatidylglycerophosphate synthase
VPLSREQVRSLAQDNPHLRADPTYATLVMRKVSPTVTWALVRFTPLSADMVTSLAIFCGIAAGLVVVAASPSADLLAALLLQLAYLFDVVDGEVARARGTAGKRGTYLDLIGHVLQNRALYAGTAVVVMQATAFAGWAIATGLAGLALSGPFGEQSRAQVLGAWRGLTSPHAGTSAGPRPRVSSLGTFLYWSYRRIAFLWEYPASMNLFCLALIADAALELSTGQGGRVFPWFGALFLGTLAVKQMVNALRQLDRHIWAELP